MTELLYTLNPELHTATARVQHILEVEQGLAVVLDRTLFYAQGGGQPGDIGIIHSSKSASQNGLKSSFTITKTLMGNDGEVLHLIGSKEGTIAEGDEVELAINQEWRQTNSLTHSAGHLLDYAIARAGLHWIPTKGFHFPEGSYVEYNVNSTLPHADMAPDVLIATIQREYDTLAQENLSIDIVIDPTHTFHGQPLRTISFGGKSPCACGGTHATSTKELADFKITKIKIKKGIARVSYSRI